MGNAQPSPGFSQPAIRSGFSPCKSQASVTATGSYDYTLQIRANYSDETVDRVVTGSQFVVDDDNSPFGAGWSLPDEAYLVFDGDNVALVSGTGGFAYFTDSGGTYTFTPGMGADEDLSLGSGTLVSSGSSYVYTDLSQTVWNFNSSGQLTSKAQPTGQTTTFSYSGGLLTSVVKPGNWANDLNYSSGLLTSIEDGYIDGSSVFHATATATYAYDSSNNLTSVTDAAGNTRTFTYDGSHLLQTDSNQNSSFSYSDGVVSSVSLGGGIASTERRTGAGARASAPSLSSTAISTPRSPMAMATSPPEHPRRRNGDFEQAAFHPPAAPRSCGPTTANGMPL